MHIETFILFYYSYMTIHIELMTLEDIGEGD